MYDKVDYYDFEMVEIVDEPNKIENSNNIDITDTTEEQKNEPVINKDRPININKVVVYITSLVIVVLAFILILLIKKIRN